MKKSAVRFLILTGLLGVALCALFGKNIYIKEKKTWAEAREYCRKHHVDLSSVNSKAEDEQLSRRTWKHDHKKQKIWIGLYKDANDTWKWSGGENASFFMWSNQEGTCEEDCCVAKNRKGWHKMNCVEEKLHFFCFDTSLVLVKENKTWEEAMEHCHHQHTELASLLSKYAMMKTLNISAEAQTDHVWTGLRYLAGNWLWVNGDVVEYEAWSQGETPQCPAWSHHCGALSLGEQHWDSWDCADKLNFVCY